MIILIRNDARTNQIDSALFFPISTQYYSNKMYLVDNFKELYDIWSMAFSFT